MVLPDLRNDLVDEILCRVPAMNLKRLRCTCKRWNRLFKDDRRFAREHSHKAPKEYLALMLTNKYRIRPMSINLQGDVTSVVLKSELSLPDPRFNSNSYQFDIYQVFHCDGLLLCNHDNNPRYGSKLVVWNPFTGQTRWIEAGNRWKRYIRFVLGYYYHQDNKNKSCSKSYKILCVGAIGQDAEIYELNSDSWRRIPDGDLTPGWSSGCSYVSLKGNTYWFAREIAKPHLGVSLLRFDFSTEKSSLFVPLPYQRPLYAILSLSAVRGEKLSVLIQPEFTSKTEIWVTSKIDDTTTTKGAVSWTKVLALDLSLDLQITDEVKFLLDEDKKVAVCCERWLEDEDETKSIDKIYILGEDNKVTEVGFDVDTNAGVWPVILNYVPSLVQIEQAGGNRIRSG